MLSSHFQLQAQNGSQAQTGASSIDFWVTLAQALIGIVEGDMLMLLIFSSHLHFQLLALKGVPKAVKPYLLTLQCTLVERGIIRNSIGRQFQVISFWTSSSARLKKVSPQQDYRSSHLGKVQSRVQDQKYCTQSPTKLTWSGSPDVNVRTFLFRISIVRDSIRKQF